MELILRVEEMNSSHSLGNCLAVMVTAEEMEAVGMVVDRMAGMVADRVVDWEDTG